MYFSCRMILQPTISEKLLQTKPSHAFGRVANALSTQLTSAQDKGVTITALGLLQSINRALRRLGINNVIRLAKDGHDFYLDEAGKASDLGIAMLHVDINKAQFDSELFKDLYLVVEHHDEHLRYVIEVDVCRLPELNKAPLQVVVNAMMAEWAISAQQSAQALPQRVQAIFASDQHYQAYVDQHSAYFNAFCTRLERALRDVIEVSYFDAQAQHCILRPQRLGVHQPRSRQSAAPLHKGYFGFDDYSYYTWHWAHWCAQHEISIQDCAVVGEDQTLLRAASQTAYNSREEALFDFQRDYTELLEASRSQAQRDDDPRAARVFDNTPVAPIAPMSSAAATDRSTHNESEERQSWWSSLVDFIEVDFSSGSDCGGSSCSGCGGD